MMEFFRGRLFKSIIMAGMAFLFVVGFGLIVAGVSPASLFGGGTPWVLKIEGEKVDLPAFQEALQRQEDRARQAREYGQEIDAVQQAEDALIQKALLVREARRTGIIPQNAVDVRRAVARDTDLADAFRVYAARFSAAQAIRAFAEDRALLGAIGAVQSLAVVTPAEIEADFIERNTKAKVRFIELPHYSYEQFVQVSDAEAKDYFDRHPEEFWRGATVNVEFLKVDPILARAAVQVSDDDIQAYYTSHRSEYEKEEVRARHILRKFPDNATPEQEDAVRKRAEEILALAKQPNADFAALATQYSEDARSAVAGGDLGWFARGAMVKPFEDAAFALQEKGELSGLVKSVHGYHIIQFEERRQSVRPMAEVKPEIENALYGVKAAEKAREDADELFFDVDASPTMEAVLNDPRYKPYSLAVRETGFFSRGDNTIANVGSAWQYGDFVRSAFEAGKGRWTEPVEIQQTYDNRVLGYFLLRVKERKPAGLPDFAAIKDDLVRRLKQRKARQLALDAAQRLWAKHRPGDDLDALLAQYKPGDKDKTDLTVRESGEFTTNDNSYIASMGASRPAMVAAFQMEPQQVRGPFPGQTGVYIIQLVERKDPDMAQLTDAEGANIRDRLLTGKRNLVLQRWYEDLRARAHVERNDAVLARF
jgi:peptidyl-prolyl cis-trans isomerase D